MRKEIQRLNAAICGPEPTMTSQQALDEVIELLRKWPDRVDGPTANDLANLLEDIQLS